MAVQTVPGKPLLSQCVTKAAAGSTVAVVVAKNYEGRSDRPLRKPSVRRLEH
jgi:hypothetical protein